MGTVGYEKRSERDGQAEVLNALDPEPNRAYFRKTLPLRLRLLAKLAKSPFIFSPPLRRLVMASGVRSIS